MVVQQLYSKKLTYLHCHTMARPTRYWQNCPIINFLVKLCNYPTIEIDGSITVLTIKHKLAIY